MKDWFYKASPTKMKHLLKSKTFWVATLQGVIGIIAVVQLEMPELGTVAIIKSILDIGLRILTKEEVKF